MKIITDILQHKYVLHILKISTQQKMIKFSENMW